MKQAPPEVHALLKNITVSLRNILGANLTGVYLYGSLTQDAFDPERSDIDCLVVTQGELSDKEFTELGNSLVLLRSSNPWTEQLQMQFLLRDEVLVMNSKSCLYQFGKLGRGSSDGNPIFWMNILKSGVVLFGQPPSEFVPEITPRILHEALVRETGYLREEIENPLSEWRDVPKYRAYAVLTLCRILYSHATGEIASKPEAANFVINNLPEDLQEVVRTALGAASDKDAKYSVNIPLERIGQFVELTMQLLRGLKESGN
ncbi:MAG TPA: aminoglycoside adenylyltransferase domain-containing protein [Pyrinomonadaceae bacterium]|jgi:predicted nucleotidyltransferase|nr:aminoglycoside adenylyltransferase domain-containing protein [Pyrinomonadaceae bacterium]